MEKKYLLTALQETISTNNGAGRLRHIMLTYSFNLCTVVFNRWIYRWFAVSSFLLNACRAISLHVILNKNIFKGDMMLKEMYK